MIIDLRDQKHFVFLTYKHTAQRILTSKIFFFWNPKQLSDMSFGYPKGFLDMFWHLPLHEMKSEDIVYIASIPFQIYSIFLFEIGCDIYKICSQPYWTRQPLSWVYLYFAVILYRLTCYYRLQWCHFQSWTRITFKQIVCTNIDKYVQMFLAFLHFDNMVKTTKYNV